MAKLKRQQDRAIRRMKGLTVISDSSSNDDDRHGPAPTIHHLWQTPTVAAVTRRAKDRRGSGENAPPPFTIIVFRCFGLESVRR